MKTRDKIIILLILITGWCLLLWSTSLPFATSFKGTILSLDETTWRIWQDLVFSKCGIGNEICHWYYGNYESIIYKGWPSLNFLFLLLAGYPFLEILNFAFRDGFTFGQIGLKKLAQRLTTYNVIILFLILILVRYMDMSILLGSGFLLYIFGLVIISIAVYFGMKRSSLTRDSNYQR